MLRVCFFIPSLSDGGAQKQCAYLINALRGRDDLDVVFVRLHTGLHDSLLELESDKTYTIHCRSNFDPLIAIRLRDILTETGSQVLISWLHASDVHSYFATRTKRSVKWIMTERDSAYPAKLRYWVREKLGRRADAIVSNSHAGDDYWQRNDARGRRYVVTNIVHPGAPAQLPVETNVAQRTVAFIGRLETQKNVLSVTRAFCILALRRRDLEFVIVGQGSLKSEIEAVIRESGADGRVRLLGFQPNVRALMRHASTVVSLSHHEGQPNVVLECIAEGVPLVLSRIPEHRDLLGDDYPFYVVNRSDERECAEMIEAAVDAENSTQFLKHGRQILREMTPRAVADRYIDVFREVVDAS